MRRQIVASQRTTCGARSPSSPSSASAPPPAGWRRWSTFCGTCRQRSGMAFVIVQHLDPTHKGIMPELLQRATAMKVLQVKDRTRVKPDCVYVIPPNKDMSILHGVLHLLEPTAPRGLRLPIDFFFRSLADDRQERSIGVILSGMGSDGTMGLRAIKEKAGVVLGAGAGLGQVRQHAQKRHRRRAGRHRGPGGGAAGKNHRLSARAPRCIAKSGTGPGGQGPERPGKDLHPVAGQTGHDFSLYKKNTVYRRIERRMGIHQIDKIATYVRFLQENPQEVELLFKEL